MRGNLDEIHEQRTWLRETVKNAKLNYSHKQKDEMVWEIIQNYNLRVRCNLTNTSFPSILIPRCPVVPREIDDNVDFHGATIFINCAVNKLSSHNKDCIIRELVLHEIGHIVAEHPCDFFPVPIEVGTTTGEFTEREIILYMAQFIPDQIKEIQAELLGIYLAISPFEIFLKNVAENNFDLRQTRKDYNLSIDCLAKIIIFILSKYPLHYFKHNIKENTIENKMLSKAISWNLSSIIENPDTAAYKCLKNKSYSESEIFLDEINVVCRAFHESARTEVEIFNRPEKMIVLGCQETDSDIDIKEFLKLASKKVIKSFLSNTCP